MIRVAGREFPLAPDGQMLVVLVAPADPASAALEVSTHQVPQIVQPVSGTRVGGPKQEILRELQRGTEEINSLVLERIDNDPVIRAFLNDEPP